MAGYAIAAVVGFLLGTYQYLRPDSVGEANPGPGGGSRTVAANPSSSPVSATPVDRVVAPESSSHADAVKTTSRSDDQSDHLVLIREDLMLRPTMSGDRFSGFLVVRNGGDPRFSVGDVIVSVNGRSVENSAAGSELLIAWLTDPDAIVKVRSAAEPP